MYFSWIRRPGTWQTNIDNFYTGCAPHFSFDLRFCFTPSRSASLNHHALLKIIMQPQLQALFAAATPEKLCAECCSMDDLPLLRTRLLGWYDAAKRDLDWRQTRDPYLIWLSEIMLQQTRVAAVIPYYRRFVARFPTVQRLASARARFRAPALGRPGILQPRTQPAPRRQGSSRDARRQISAEPSRRAARCPALAATRRRLC